MGKSHPISMSWAHSTVTNFKMMMCRCVSIKIMMNQINFHNLIMGTHTHSLPLSRRVSKLCRFGWHNYIARLSRSFLFSFFASIDALQSVKTEQISSIYFSLAHISFRIMIYFHNDWRIFQPSIKKMNIEILSQKKIYVYINRWAHEFFFHLWVDSIRIFFREFSIFAVGILLKRFEIKISFFLIAFLPFYFSHFVNKLTLP